jgi:hypothetical protein
MLSLSGKMADKIAAKKQSAHKEKLQQHTKTINKKLRNSLKGADLTSVKKKSVKTKALLDKKANPDALAKSKKKVSSAVKKLSLKHAGFGRYHKGKGMPITHWVMRSPTSGLYILADKEIRQKLLAKAPKKVIKKPRTTKLATKKANVIKMHIKRMDQKRAALLAKKGKAADTPMSKREQARRDTSVKKLEATFDKLHAKKVKKVKK